VVAVCLFSIGLCGFFVALTRLATAVPADVLRSVLTGLSFFILPLATVAPLCAALWALALLGAWALRGPVSGAPRVAVRIPDRLPEDWSFDDPLT